nr:Autophagy protein 11 [Hymenolepis microstoma]
MYVFLMSKCCLVKVDNSSLHERFGSLYTYLAQYYQLPYDRMILLSDGGYQLNHVHSIKDHDVGETCDNPIYVFVRECAISPAPCSLKFLGLPKEVLNYLDQPFPNMLITDLQACFKKISSALDADAETIRQLEQDQRLMCFGWFIAQANFEHDLQDFQENMKGYWKDYEYHCSEVGRWEAIFNKFSAIKERLQSVPLLQSLLPTSSDLTNETINIYGPPRTLYDWMCHQTAHIVPRRPNAPNLAGPVGSGFHLTSTASSSLDISAVPLNILCRNPSKFPANTSFYLSTSSSSQGDSFTPSVVPSLESTLIELVEDSAAKLKMLNDSSGDMSMTNHKTSMGDDGDTNSVLMMGDELDDQQPQEDDKPMALSTGPKLPFVYSKLKSFADLLDVAPRDAECSSHNEIHESDEVNGSIRIAQPNRELNCDFSSHSISISSMGSSLVRHPAANTPSSLPFMAWPSPKHEIQQQPDSIENSDDGIVNWRCSKRYFSRHLDNLTKVQDAAQNTVRQVKDYMSEVLLGFKNHARLKEQEGLLFNIRKLLKHLGTLLQSIIQMKGKLADVISRLQVQLQSFSSESMNKDRECVRCFAYLSNISKCSAVLYQLQDSPELYIKCLLEIIRRRRLSSLWNSLTERFTRYYAEFQHTESQRRESLAFELKDHLLAEIFRPLNTFSLPCLRFSHPGRHVSRVSLISLSSSKRLSSNGKCLSTSHLNNPSPTAFRLSAANRPRTVVIPPNNDILSTNNNNTIDRTENSLPSINEAEVRELTTRLPQDLAAMITKALKELESEEYKMMAGFHLAESDDEMEDRLTEMGWQKQLRRRSRLFSSPGILAHGFSRQNCQIQAVDASTNTKEEPLKSPTSDKGVEVNFEAICDQSVQSPPSPPSEPVDQSTDLYLSIEVSNFPESLISPTSASRNLSSNFFSPQGSHSEAETDPEGTDSLVAPSYPSHLNEALTAQSATLKKLVEQLNTGLPTHLGVKLPTFTPGEETKYLNETVSCINQLLSHLEACKLTLVASVSTASLPSSTEPPTLPTLPPKTSTKSVSIQASQQSSNQSTECPSREIPVTQTASISINESISSLSNNLSTHIFHNNFAFSNFRSENLVIFIPIVVSAKNQPSNSTMNDVPVGEDVLTTGGGISFWGKQSLRLLSSDIISSSLTPSNATGVAVEQWRMLSNDGLVYFLHDDEFDAFNVARSACQPAASALCRTGNTSQATLLSEPVLPLARRAVPFVIGVFQRKEKCISKKDENRFGLPRDFVFFRVRARPL